MYICDPWPLMVRLWFDLKSVLLCPPVGIKCHSRQPGHLGVLLGLCTQCGGHVWCGASTTVQLWMKRWKIKWWCWFTVTQHYEEESSYSQFGGKWLRWLCHSDWRRQQWSCCKTFGLPQQSKENISYYIWKIHYNLIYNVSFQWCTCFWFMNPNTPAAISAPKMIRRQAKNCRAEKGSLMSYTRGIFIQGESVSLNLIIL